VRVAEVALVPAPVSAVLDPQGFVDCAEAIVMLPPPTPSFPESTGPTLPPILSPPEPVRNPITEAKSRFDAQMRAGQLANERAATARAVARRRRKIAGSIVAFVAFAGVVAMDVYRDRETSSALTKPRVDSEVRVDAEIVEFTMPARPKHETISDIVAGSSATGEAWNVEDGGGLLQVLVIDYRASISAEIAASAIDNSTRGMVTRSKGTLAYDDAIASPGQYAHRFKIDIDGGEIFGTTFIHRDHLISIVIGVKAGDPPTAYTNLLESLTLT
jgi:hypothetical protein